MTERTSPLAGEECFRCEHAPDPYVAHVYRIATRGKQVTGFLWFFLCADCAGDVDAMGEGESLLDVLLDYAGEASRWPSDAPDLSYVDLPKCTCESKGTPVGCPWHWGP